MTKGEEAFLDQYTRKLMVDLCRSQMAYGDPLKGMRYKSHPLDSADAPFLRYAVKKKWVNKDLSAVLGAGWMTAARFLKR